jgi:methionyl-tRNA formyltransferase
VPGIVMLVGKDPVSNIIYHALAQTFALDGVIREEKPPVSTFLRRRLRKLGFSKVAGQLLFAAGIVPIVTYCSRRRVQRIISLNRLDTSEIPTSCTIDVPSVNSDVTITELRRLSPRVVIVNGTRIIQDRVLRSVDAIFLNTHAGITPMYRGVHGGYWALASHDPTNCGVTVHKVDKGIDTGSIVAQATITPTVEDTFATYPYLQIASAIPLLKKAVGDALSGELSEVPPPPGKSQLWTHPTAWQYLKNRIRTDIR